MIPAPRSLVLPVSEAAATLWDAGRPSGVVLVHGLLGRRTMHEIVAIAELLAERHDVLALDVRGHGETPGRFTWGREEWREVAAGVDHLAATGRRVAVVGFSFGGFHAVRAAAHGAPIERLALIGAPADLRVLDHFPLGPKLWRHLPAMRGRGRRRLSAEIPRRSSLRDDELARVKIPVLVVHGEGDWLISERHARRLAGALSASKRLDIPGGFHGEYLVHSHGRELAEALREFLG
ncbi:MAG TPA: alpha/beta fold hydrolase [Candidatus Polarisedimenticolaceae bacterium]|nr:alpha/beta fold hydrolase [Candidatus Polarisedimenticolaceae bacterium]